ncbi:PREDICTED: uncharacterized protein LOC106743216 [Dinoponera quadriceps]|uniref:Uncharacterized protein LOC106743216 n=1 Tax=Dinoponera quadriceps TaxID=609295 RepID=A0A6P3X203_DINQU|nr:PREDICTED: uncharacterized protein LOC106743216 [Dinoponera quadriceps]XP_014472334.1 PREDICTED: uncharacterized protein LOC106743216 [Dinoponera quadriceps]
MTKNRTIRECYANLEYDEFDIQKARSQLSDLSETIFFPETYSKRFLEMATVIEKNLPLFQSYCRHVDIVSTIIEYLKYYSMKFVINEVEVSFDAFMELFNLVNTLFFICMRDYPMRLFISKLESKTFREQCIRSNMEHRDSDEHYEMIILEDSDLHAVVKEIRNFYFDKIWIQELLVPKLSSFMNECKAAHHFDIFRSKQELLDSTSHSEKLSIISIWSENIIAAKDLAAFLNRDVTFINTYMDFYGSIVLFPPKGKSDSSFSTLFQNTSTSTRKLGIFGPLSTRYNLFFDGMWQKPVEDTYWNNKGFLWANATNEDIKRCIAAAEKGAKIWSARSIDSRMQVLSKLAHTLECNNKFELTDIILKWTKSSHFYENSIMHPQSGRLEITEMRKPRGIIILKGKNLNVLFWQLTLALITGNSVIVLCNDVDCSLIPYCDMFSTSGIPPGVINMLSIEKMKDILYGNFKIDESLFFTQEGKENFCMKFTIPKIIVLPVK